MKKIILTLGSMGLVTTPITTLVSCGDSKKTTNNTTSTIKEKIDNAIGKLSDTVDSTNTSSQLSANIGSKIVNDPVDVSLLGLPNNYSVIDDGLSISYTINTAYDSSTKLVKLNVKISSLDDSSVSSIKIITVRAASFDFSADKAKFGPLTSTKTATELANDVSDVNNVSNVELGIDNPRDLTSGLTVTYSITNKIFATGTTKTVTAHLSYGDQIDTTTFDLTPHTFDFSADKAKFGPLTSSKTATELVKDVSNVNNVSNVELGIENPTNLTNGLTVTYSIVNKTFTTGTAKTVTAHLTYGDQIDTTTFDLTPYTFDFTNEKAKFHDLTSSKTATELANDVSDVNNVSNVELGIENPTNLTNGVTVIYSIANKTFTTGTAKTVTVHLSYGDQTDTTTFDLMPYTFDFTNEKAKFHDLTSSKVVDDLIADINTVNNITDQQLGIVTPTLADGVTIFYSIVDKTFTKGNPKVVTVHLSYSGQTDITTFNLKPNTIKIVHNVKLTTIKGIRVMASDGHGGAFVGGDEGKLEHIDANGNKPDGWSTKTLLGGEYIHSIVSDGHDGFFVGGFHGKLDHIDASGNKPHGWTTKTLLDGNAIYSIISDGSGGFWVGGDRGKLDHIDADGNLVHEWTTKTLLGGSTIYSMISDGNAGFWVGGSDGKLDYIDGSGNKPNGWTTKTLIEIYGTAIIFSIISDGNGGAFVGGYSGQLDHVDAHGDLVDGWKTKTLINSATIHSMISDGHGGAFVGGQQGKLDHIDASGDLVDGWSTQTWVGGKAIYSIISDGHDGFWISGISGQLVHFIYKP